MLYQHEPVPALEPVQELSFELLELNIDLIMSPEGYLGIASYLLQFCQSTIQNPDGLHAFNFFSGKRILLDLIIAVDGQGDCEEEDGNNGGGKIAPEIRRML
jgi:hypothetical protein